MTLPYERFRAVLFAREFLGDLIDSKKTPRIPREVRKRALSVLRHYPLEYEMKRASELAPEIFSSPSSQGKVNMTFEEFVSKVDSLHNTHRELRYGQSLMIVLGEVWVEKYREITGTDDDCFYDDATVRLTLDKLEKEWKE